MIVGVCPPNAAIAALGLLYLEYARRVLTVAVSIAKYSVSKKVQPFQPHRTLAVWPARLSLRGSSTPFWVSTFPTTRSHGRSASGTTKTSVKLLESRRPHSSMVYMSVSSESLALCRELRFHNLQHYRAIAPRSGFVASEDTPFGTFASSTPFCGTPFVIFAVTPLPMPLVSLCG